MREIGRVLREGRIALGLEIGNVAQRTRISPYYLRALEEGRFQIIPKVFDKGYLKIYANFLHIDFKPILAMFDERRNRESERFPASKSA